jgi:hypothetical protein
MHAVSPEALPAAGQGATQVSFAPNATTLGTASGQLTATPTPRNWIAIGLGIALAATIAVLVVVMTRTDDPPAPPVVSTNPTPPAPKRELPAPVTIEVPPKPPTIEVKPPAQPAETRERPRTSSMLRVWSVPPGAEIKLTRRGTSDVRNLGLSPIAIELAPGEYRLTATLDGALKEAMIEVKRGVPVARTFQFRRASAAALPEKLEANEIQAIVKRETARIRVCAGKAGGAFIPQIEVTISPSGKDVRTRDVQPGMTSRSECFQNLIRSVTFPPSKTGGFAKVLFPEQAPPIVPL